MTVFRPIAAFVTALAAGITNNLLIRDEDPADPEETASCTCSTCSTLSEDPGFAERIYAGIRFLGKRSAALYLAMIAICSVALGLALDFLYLGMGLETTAIAGCVSEVLPQEVKLLFAVFMLLAMTYAMYHAMRE
jgi:uncharacterized membrane protein YraQ (UPF0718 family)